MQNNTKSELNKLLVELDAYATGHKPGTVEDLRRILGCIEKLFADPDFEVNRDLFDRVSNDTRRAVVLGFVACMSGLASIDGVLVALLAAAEERNAEGGDGANALEKVLKAQKRGVN